LEKGLEENMKESFHFYIKLKDKARIRFSLNKCGLLSYKQHEI